MGGRISELMPVLTWPAFQHEEHKLNDRRDDDVRAANISLKWLA